MSHKESKSDNFVDEATHKYVNAHSLRLTPHQQQLVDYTMTRERNIMLASLDQIQFFTMLVKATGVKKCLEVGTYTGYTTMSLASVLPADGKVITLDISSQYIAFDIWKASGLEHKIDLRIGEAVDSLDELIANGESGTFDFVFIDADKLNIISYYEKALQLVRQGGLIAIDNVLWFGRVVDEKQQDPDTVMLRRLNELIRDDTRVDISMLTIGDGVTFCYKK